MGKYVFGPIPSRRLGRSLGVSPVIDKVCNYSCIYCQLGRTNKLSNLKEMFYPVDAIIREFKAFLERNIGYDVVSICGEGEPTLYLGLKDLISKLKQLTHKPIVIITNGALLDDEEVKGALYEADIVMPSLDAYDEASFRTINRPRKDIKFANVYNGLKTFSKHYKGTLFLEIMFIKDINDDDALNKYSQLLKDISYDKLYLNTPIRPPAESFVEVPSDEFIYKAANKLKGQPINKNCLKFYSNIKDDYAAIVSIIKRHPMTYHEVMDFLKERKCNNIDRVITRLNNDEKIDLIKNNYRLKK